MHALRWTSITMVTVSKMGQRKTLRIGVRMPGGQGMLELHAFSGLTGLGSKDPTDDQTQRAFFDSAYDTIFKHAAGDRASTAGYELVTNRDFVAFVPGGERRKIGFDGAAPPSTAGTPSTAPAGYVPQYTPLPPVVFGPISGGGKALVAIGLVIVLVGIGLLLKGVQIQKAPAMAIGAAVASLGFGLFVVGKKLRR